jgi:predicted metal-dependent peptidase
MSAITSVKDKITTARVGLLLRSPFYGSLSTRLIVKEASDWCKTAATDGRHIYYNQEFFEKMTVKQIEFVVAHEILHNVFSHFDRRDSRDAQVFNMACDYSVNGQLIRDSIGKPPDMNFLHDTKYYGMGSEEVYDLLMQDAKTIDLSTLGDLLDDHIDWTKDDGTGRPTFTKEELKEIRDEVREAMIQAAQSAGNVPASVARLIQNLTTSKMNWRELLRQQIQSTIRNDFSFARPNRKSQHLSAVLPGSNYDETIDICVALDMSGSISNTQAMEFISEVKGIMEEYRGFKIKVLCWDTKVYNVQDFDEFNMDDIESYEPMGGGGTDPTCIYNMFIDEDYVPKRLINFTDGFVNTWGIEDYCPSLFIIHGSNNIVPDFGEYAYYDEA